MIKDFYKHNEYHLCRFCGINIRHLVEKVTKTGVKYKMLEPNALFAQGEIPLRGGTKFTFNGCITCVNKVDQSQFMKICKNDANMVKYMNKSDMRPKLAKCKVKVRDIAYLYANRLRSF